MAELSIIIVNWNSIDYSRACLASIFANTPAHDFEVIVVDNASSKGDVEILQEQFPQIKLIKNKENVGFAGANNIGFLESTGTYLLFLNPDTVVLGHAIGEMLDQIKTLADAGAIGCRLLNSDQSVQTSCIQRFPTIWNQALAIEVLRLRWPHWKVWAIAPLFSEGTAPVSVEVISGACLMVRRDVFEAVGQFSREYYMYAEDVDLCYSIRLLGWRCYYINGASVIHHGGGSSKQRREHNWSTVMQLKAVLKFCKKTRGSLYARLYQFAMGISATAHLLLLLPLFMIRRRNFFDCDVRLAISKWTAVLSWAVGAQYQHTQR